METNVIYFGASATAYASNTRRLEFRPPRKPLLRSRTIGGICNIRLRICERRAAKNHETRA